MFRLSFKALLLTLFIFSSLHVFADHMMGAEMSWTQTGKDTFIVVVTDYRDCNGIPFNNSPLTLEPSCGTQLNINGTASNGIDVTPVSKGHCDRCNDATCALPYGIQQYKISFKVVLTAYSCCDFYLAWNQCCRSAAITTGGYWAGFQIRSYLNKCAKGKNNSPSFIYPAQQLACNGLCSILSNTALPGGQDLKGKDDSLVYELVPTMQDDKSESPFITGYSYKTPVKYYGYPDTNASWDKGCQGFHVDHTNGVIKFRATKEDVTNYAMQVTSYRKDSTGTPKIISSVIRDVQLYILSCNKATTSQPMLSGVNGTGYTKAYVMAGDTTCFTFYTNDSNASDTVKLNYNKTINWASYTPQTGVKHPTFTFCLHPDSTNISQNPYYFTLEAYSDQYPLKGYVVNTYEIYVIRKPYFGFTVNDSIQCYSKNKFNFTNTSKDTVKYTYEWDFGDSSALDTEVNAKHQYSKTGTYLVKMQTIYGGLPLDSEQLQVRVVADPHAVFYTADSNMCGNSKTVHFINTSKNDSAYTAFEWNFGDGLYTLAYNPVHTYNKYGTYKVKLMAAVNNSCIDTFSKTIIVANKPEPAFMVNKDTQCLTGNTFLFDNLTYVSGNATYTWDYGDSTSEVAPSPVHIYKHAGTYKISLTATSAAGCDSTTDMYVTVNKSIAVSKITGPDSVKVNHDLVYMIRPVAGQSYQWSVSGNNKIDNDTANRVTISWTDTGTAATIKVWVTNAPDGCTDTSFLQVYVKQPSGLSEAVDPYHLHIYPNPASGHINVEFTTGKSEEGVIYVTDVTGRELYRQPLSVIAGQHRQELSVEGLSKGVYFLNINASEGHSISKIVVK